MPIFSTRAALALGLSCMSVATPALAALDGQSTVVHFADLNLATPKGERTLRRRVAQAVELVCGDADPGDLDRMREMAACRAMATAGAAPQMQLAIADAHNPRHMPPLASR